MITSFCKTRQLIKFPIFHSFIEFYKPNNLQINLNNCYLQLPFLLEVDISDITEIRGSMFSSELQLSSV